MEDWDYKPTLSGTPQGGVISPILSNIHLDRLDQYVEKTLIPENTRGKRRRANPEYRALWNEAERERKLGHREEARQLEKQYQTLPTTDQSDPSYRRLRYIRYADDFLLGYTGTEAEAEKIKEQLATFLRDHLKLEMSAEKTLITHAGSNAARFLGYEITTSQCDTKHTNGRRSINGLVALRIPATVLEARCALYQEGQKKGHQPIHRAELMNDDAFSIVARYQSEYRGYVQYYVLAENIARLGKLRWVTEISLTKTLASKYQVSVPTIYQRFGDKVETPHGPRKCLKVTLPREGKAPLIAIFGGIPLRRNPTAVIKDQPTYRYRPERSELSKRLLAQECEICGATEKIEVHHIRKLADLDKEGRTEKPLWAQIMSARRRKTLVLCKPCHLDLHAGRMQKPKETE
jgi:hypothetical protein